MNLGHISYLKYPSIVHIKLYENTHIYIYIYIYIYTPTILHTYVHASIHPSIPPSIHPYIHPPIHTYITLHYVTLRYVTLRYITLHTYIHFFPQGSPLRAGFQLYRIYRDTYIYTWSLACVTPSLKLSQVMSMMNFSLYPTEISQWSIPGDAL